MKIKIIAEIGNTHEGSLGLAKQFIKVAAECGVDAVKFQTHIFDFESLETAPNPPYFKDETRKEYFNRTSFSIEQWKELKRFTEQDIGIEFLSSPFSIEAIKLLEEIGVTSYKVPSGEVTNIPFLEVLSKTGKPILLSSGMSSWDEIDDAIKILLENGCPDLTVLQCTSEYPCPPEESGLNVLDEFKNRYPKLKVGYSDHTLGIAIPLAAVIKGAVVIEKHFTLSKNMYGSDAKNSTEPEEFKHLVYEIRALEKALTNSVDKDKKAIELKTMKETFQKSIVLETNLSKGTIIENEHLAFKKPGNGIEPKYYKDIIGKKLNNDLQKDTMLKWEHFE